MCLAVKLHADQLSDTGGAALAAGIRRALGRPLEYTSDAGVEAMAPRGHRCRAPAGAFYALRENAPSADRGAALQGCTMAIASDCNPGTFACNVASR
jgi:imidazolonepropionase